MHRGNRIRDRPASTHSWPSFLPEHIRPLAGDSGRSFGQKDSFTPIGSALTSRIGKIIYGEDTQKKGTERIGVNREILR
jgi:hypothetical protein